MSVIKDKWNGYKGNTWRVICYYRDYNGVRKRHEKRGFATKHEAVKYEHDFLERKTANVDISFDAFVDIYMNDKTPRLKKSTVFFKKRIIDKHLRPYFGNKCLSDITPLHVLTWQNELMRYRDENGKGFSQTYLRTINNQLSAIMNHAVKYYGLSRNPSSVDKKMGQSKAVEMKFWTQEEFERFIPAVSDKPVSYTGFMILFWTGLRIGELLALTPADIDLEKRRLTVNKTYQRIEGEDLISEPKTPKSRRTISLPAFLCDYIADYEKRLVGLENDDRLFPYTKYFFEHEMQRGVKESGVKKIRIHDLRHSHASLLVSMGFSIKEIQQRLGHEKVETTLNTYAHLYPDTQDELADRLDIRFKGKENDG